MIEWGLTLIVVGSAFAVAPPTHRTTVHWRWARHNMETMPVLLSSAFAEGAKSGLGPFAELIEELDRID